MRRLVLFLIIAVALAAGCATVPQPQVPLEPGARVETLAATVSLSVKTPDGSTGGNGYLLYRRPDRFHMVMLTPFGTTALEFFAAGERITILLPSKGQAYVGTFADLPAKGGLQGWRMMQWVVEGSPLYRPEAAGRTEEQTDDGGVTLATYGPDGLLERKQSARGEVIYRNYCSLEGVPFPALIEFSDSHGVRVKISFDDPEVNTPLDDAALTPSLEGVTVMPLAGLKGL